MSEHPPTSAQDTAAPDLPEQLRVRRAKRDRLLARGVDPYPVGVPRTHGLAAVADTFSGLAAGEGSGTTVGVAGRVVHLRDTGKLCFAVLQDGTGSKLQAMLSLAAVGAEGLAAWKADVDLGDHVWVRGEVVRSRRGELSVLAQEWGLAAKALRPLPTLHADLSEEARVRQRYVDLIVNPSTRDMVRLRADILRSLRETLHRGGYVEVETPTLQLLQGGAAARPFRTHLHAFDVPMYLRIALELYLKRGSVGGLDRVYEIGRIFRNEGVDSTHSPEFTMLEAYEAYGDYHSVAELTRELVLDAARSVGRTVVPDGQGGELDLESDWRWLPVHAAVSAAVEEEVTPDTGVDALRKLADRHEVGLDPAWGAGEIVLELYEKLVEHTLREPTFVCDYPASVKPLARQHRGDPRLAESWDLVIAGVERVMANSELVDPVLQRERLADQSRRATAGDEEAMPLDEDFLRALEFGMPPTGGIGLGVDRLVMLLSGAGIRDTILFPVLRPE